VSVRVEIGVIQRFSDYEAIWTVPITERFRDDPSKTD
jgi:hypothetical protein